MLHSSRCSPRSIKINWNQRRKPNHGTAVGWCGNLADFIWKLEFFIEIELILNAKCLRTTCSLLGAHTAVHLYVGIGFEIISLSTFSTSYLFGSENADDLPIFSFITQLCWLVVSMLFVLGALASEMEWLWGTFSISPHRCWINNEQMHEVSPQWHGIQLQLIKLCIPRLQLYFSSVNRCTFTTYHHHCQAINVTVNLCAFREAPFLEWN